MPEFQKSDATMMTTAWELSASLLSFIVALGIGYWVGRWLDQRLGTAPWMFGTFLAFGFAAGALNVYRTVSRAVRQTSTKSGGPGRESGHGQDGRAAP